MFVFLCACVLCASAVWAQHAVPNDVVGGGGGQSSGGGYYLHDTIGQPCIDVMSGASNTARGGYWYIVDRMHIGPTSEVMITAFDAVVLNDGVLLIWAIGSAVELSGFNIYRAPLRDGDFEQLNADLLPVYEEFSYLDAPIRPGESYRYMIGAVDRDGEMYSQVQTVVVPPRETTLYQNYPNPFNPLTTVSFYIPDTERVSLVIFDAQGRVIRTLVNERREYGSYDEIWEGMNDRGEPVGSGIYFYRLQAGKKVITKKLSLIK